MHAMSITACMQHSGVQDGMWHSCDVFWQRNVHTKINLGAVRVALLHGTSGVQSVAASCCNKAGCKILHKDLNLRCLTDSNQLQTSMMVATMCQVVLHAVLLIIRNGFWRLLHTQWQAMHVWQPCKHMHDSPAAAAVGREKKPGGEP